MCWTSKEGEEFFMATEVIMPQLGLTMVEGKLTKWLKEEGSQVVKGDPLFEVMTDKITVTVEATADGVLARILITAGQAVPVLTPVALLAAPGEKIEPAASTTGAVEKAGPVEIRATPAAKKAARDHGIDLAKVMGSGSGGRIVEEDVQKLASSVGGRPAERTRCTPVAARMTHDHGLNTAEIQGTGIGGRVSRADVERALADRKGAEAAEEPRSVPLAGMRQVIARRMHQSWSVAPHVTHNMQVDMSSVGVLRNGLKNRNIKLTYTEFFVKVVGKALAGFPYLNASLTDEYITLHRQINIGVAVGLDDGLIVPVVRDAGKKGLQAISLEVKDLVQRARAGQLGPDDIKGGTFTISNLGMYDVDSFTPIINQPEAAILGLNRIVQLPVVENGAVVIRPCMNMSLSFDHRLVDGAYAAKFLQRVKEMVENPIVLVL